MNDNTENKEIVERRSDQRKPPDKYYSVQFSVKDLGYFYQFKIWDVSSSGMCILVNQESSILGHLHVGDVLKMQYYLAERVGSTEEFDTEISHITKSEEGRFKGHTLVGLKILDSGQE